MLAFLTAVGINAQSRIDAADSYAGGSGTKDDPYQIATVEQWAFLAENVKSTPNYSRGKYFKLTADLVFNENVLGKDLGTLATQTAFPVTPMVGDYTSETNYTAFQGVFDGGGHSISGVYIVDWGNAVALFKAVDGATIKNLEVKDAYLYAGNYMGGIVSVAFNSKFINCSLTDSYIRSWSSQEGGIVGRTIGTCSFKNCYVFAQFNVKNNSGGIAGRAGGSDAGGDSTVFENCYTKAEMTYSKTGTDFGGIVGYAAQGTYINNCWMVKSGTSPYSTKTSTGVTIGHVCQLPNAKFTTVHDTLNVNAESIPGACRWTTMTKPLSSTSDKTSTFPCFDFSTFTPEEEEDDINSRVTDPYPSDGDLHVLADADGKVTFSWTASADGLTASHNLYFGTSREEVDAMTTPTVVLGTDTSYVGQDFDITKTYYWRVDRVTAEGNASKGDVWSFQTAHLAFPGAEGYGRLAHGGRGGSVVYVTNLNDSGEGSLRWALTNGSGPRTVLFKVSGLINLLDSKDIRCADNNVTIAGQTAPGIGICVAGASVGIGDDDICRFIRSRRGGTPDTGGSLGFFYAKHAIIDHCSASWGTDETYSSRGCGNITFQHNIISEALGIAGHRNYPEGTNHGYAATIGGSIGSHHHNLLADCYGRNWSMGGGADAKGNAAGELDMFNNVCYNWGRRTTDGGARQMQFVNNYYKMGIDTRLTNLFSADNEMGGHRQQFAYVSGNIRDNKDGSLSEDKINDTYRATGDYPEETWVDEPFFDSHAKIESARSAYRSVLSDVGANLPMMDNTDTRIINETLNRSYTYVGSKSGIRGEIDNEADAGGYEVYPETEWADDYDSDLDGLPDWWETIHGTNANSPAGDFSDSNADSNGDGYTALEDYLDFMAQPHYLIASDSTLNINMKQYFRGFTNAPQFSVENTSSFVMATVADSVLTVKPLEANKIAELTMTVADADGYTYSRRLFVATPDAYVTGISSVSKSESASLRSFEVFDMGGAKVMGGNANGNDISHLQLSGIKSGVYIVKAVTTDGKTVSAKIIKP